MTYDEKFVSILVLMDSRVKTDSEWDCETTGYGFQSLF